MASTKKINMGDIMRKKITKIIESSLPQLFDRDGESLSRRAVANKILDSLPYPERLNLLPFEKWIPMICSMCKYNDANRLGCTYELFNEDAHSENPAPEDCPLEY